METFTYHIRSYCTVRHGAIHIDGQPFLEQAPEIPLHELLKGAYRKLGINYSKFHKMDELSKAAFIATELMAQSSGPYDTDTALIFANRSSSHLADSEHAQIIADEGALASPATFVYTLPNIAMGEISIRHQLHSENVFFIFDSYLPDFLVPYTHTVMEDRPESEAISGWAEVTAQQYDVLLYRIGGQGEIPYTVDHLNRLYNNVR